MQHAIAEGGKDAVLMGTLIQPLFCPTKYSTTLPSPAATVLSTSAHRVSVLVAATRPVAMANAMAM